MANIAIVGIALLLPGLVVLMQLRRRRISQFPRALLFPKMSTLSFICSSASAFLSVIIIFGGQVLVSIQNGLFFQLGLFVAWSLAIFAALRLLLSSAIAPRVAQLSQAEALASPARFIGQSSNERLFLCGTLTAWCLLLMLTELFFVTMWLEWVFAPLGLSAWPTIILCVIALASYCAVGGYHAVMQTDRWQLCVLIGCFVAFWVLVVADTNAPQGKVTPTFLYGSAGQWDWASGLLALSLITLVRFVISPDAWFRTQMWLRTLPSRSDAQSRSGLCAIAIAAIFVAGSAFALSLIFTLGGSIEVIDKDNPLSIAFVLFRESTRDIQHTVLASAVMAVVLVFAAMSTIDTYSATIAQLRLERQLTQHQRNAERLLTRTRAIRSLRRSARSSMIAAPALTVIISAVLYHLVSFLDLLAITRITLTSALAISGAHFYVLVLALLSQTGRFREIGPRWAIWLVLFMPAVFAMVASLVDLLPLGPPRIVVFVQLALFVLLLLSSIKLRRGEPAVAAVEEQL